MIAKKHLLIIITILATYNATQEAKFFALNVFRPWDVNLRPEKWKGNPFQIQSYGEFGINAQGYNPEGHKVNVMQIWTPTQDALAMLYGFPANSPETEYLNTFLPGIIDDGVRGNFDVTGKFHMNANVGFAARYHFRHNVTFGLYLPVYAMKLNNVIFTDLTGDTNAQDLTVRENLTDKFTQVLAQFDPSLSLSGWNRVGVGDLAATAEFLRYYPQQKPYLKNVGIYLRTGLTFPTGKRTNINEIMSIPFGYDGSWSLFGDAGIMVNWFDFIKAGINFEFIYLFGHTSEQRIKTDPLQTDFLYLAKAKAHTEYGFTQFYNLFIEAHRFYRGLSLGCTYQYWKHGDDKLALATNQYSNAIANTAENLQEWKFHQVIFNARYDCDTDLDECAPIKPQFHLFYKLPVAGKRALLVSTIGAAITFNF